MSEPRRSEELYDAIRTDARSFGTLGFARAHLLVCVVYILGPQRGEGENNNNSHDY